MHAGKRDTELLYQGMSRETMKAVVLNNMVIGKYYRICKKEIYSDENEKELYQLVDLCKNMAVFKQEDGTRKSFLYVELCTQMSFEEVPERLIKGRKK